MGFSFGRAGLEVDWINDAPLVKALHPQVPPLTPELSENGFQPGFQAKGSGSIAQRTAGPEQWR